jgi:hypothetical protein
VSRSSERSPLDIEALESLWVTSERRLACIRNMPSRVRHLHAAEADRLAGELDAIERRLGFDSPTHGGPDGASDLPHRGRSVYLPSPKEIESLKRQIRAENEAREALKGGRPDRLQQRPVTQLLK